MKFFIMLGLVALVSLPVIAQDEPAADEQTIEVSQETEEDLTSVRVIVSGCER